jgi:hypothetical protein
LEIQETKTLPKVVIKEIGEMKVVVNKTGGYKSEFYFTLPETYHLEVRADGELIKMELPIVQHTFLDFQNEFGIFFVLFLIVMGGIVLWTRKIMKSQTRKI